MSDENDFEEKQLTFRFNRGSVFLTYSQVEEKLQYEDIITMFTETLHAHFWVIGRELHQDGGKHFHAYAEFPKINSVNPRVFDLKECHPNIRKPNKNKLGCVEYCMKHGDYKKSDSVMAKMFPNSTGFGRKMDDHKAWINFMETGAVEPVKWPIRLPDGALIDKPIQSYKKRHWLIQGVPSSGKTYWAKHGFRNQDVYWVPNENGYPFEEYNSQEVIIFDDYDLGQRGVSEMIIQLAEVWFDNQHHVPGKVRYKNNHLKKDQVRTIFILTNDMPIWMGETRMISRFNTMSMNEFGMNE